MASDICEEPVDAGRDGEADSSLVWSGLWILSGEIVVLFSKSCREVIFRLCCEGERVDSADVSGPGMGG